MIDSRDRKVPAVAIEFVYVWNNTSVMVDEVFSQRLGMIPLNVDPDFMELKESALRIFLCSHFHLPIALLPFLDMSDQATDRNTVVFKLDVTCTRNTAAPKDATEASQLYINSEVLSGQLEWIPQGEQATVFPVPPAPTNPNIVLMKLRPGQEVCMEMHAVKGVGKDHAKFSAVGLSISFLIWLGS